ncbi:beta-N-acetylglucosaminidase domain-containing protein [Parageobacillus sp. VR-IP]|uniref:protein O-GlcNAcase n=1 Tax=Parageobacillus sp. VR-IP TaxID=2742205 RepID=UPI001583FE4F|nr:protein O-GlcNAcase [Parageobacillus sp. VR-IP]NUK30260.1 beta-N-acetylglucosaminidase domain-containing protein [Parageobacillus sp. VR-IP]
MVHSPFQIRGVIEGFYGVFYTPPERNNLISFLGENGYNLYIYSPKNDRQHRVHWREPYPDSIMEQFQKTVELSRKVGVEFCYSLSPGLSINYASEEDFKIVVSKLKTFYDIGVRTFMVSLDDISSKFRYKEEKEKFKTYAEAHVYLANRLYAWLKKLDNKCRLMLCPTDYYGKAPFSQYIYELGEGLHPDIDVFYTGPDICSETISEQETGDFAEAIKRRPIIWDNYPVNDLAMRVEIHIGPITGRSAALPSVCKGFVVNTMSEAEASKIALLTFSDYFRDPVHYQPWVSWEKALQKVAGKEHSDALKIFAENTLYSCLKHVSVEKLKQLTDKALDLLYAGERATDSLAIQRLHSYLDSIDEACYDLKFRMSNYALRNNLLPWIESLESWAWAGRRAIAVLKAIENEEDIAEPYKWLEESLKEVENHLKRVSGSLLVPIIEYARLKADQEKGIIR